MTKKAEPGGRARADEGGVMPEANLHAPKCPMCAGDAELKEVLRREDHLHSFFRCRVCTVIFPVVELIKKREPER